MFRSKREVGQTIVLIAVIIFGLVAMSALIVDGGNAYLSRRQAQTAADSAALAAAYEKCVNNVVDLQPIVDEYAVSQNHADSAIYAFSPPDSDFPKGKITVTTEIEKPTFFGKVMSIDTLKVNAKASVGCFLPAEANNLLPVAWTCTVHEGTVETCIINTIPVNVFDTIEAQPFDFDTGLLDEGDEVNPNSYQDGVGGKLIYMVMDDADFDENLNCKELNLRDDVGPPLGDLGDPPGVGLITCDFDGDGVMNVQGSERGWLDLGGGGGAVDLWTMMLEGYDGVLEMPQWFVASDGVKNSVFINAHLIKFRKSLVPVYNAICPIPLSGLAGTSDETLPVDCPTVYEAGDLISPSTGSQEYFRVPGVAVFVITCVSKGVPEPCPGKTLSGVTGNTSSIEGYFVSGYVAGTRISNSGFDLGVYVLSLVE